ncbi:uncharacterized protein LOC128220360 [Mya arenaria]|uniref:uncharacterized protein LOC128220360 n=1 Tax=Mya arenaria TaxID=6604 RepID=UPI0022E1E7BF|nr:uncharacterized protein LOC128220360 [Mya arenaria]
MTKVDDHDIVAAHEACVKPDVDMKGLGQCLEHKRVFMFFCKYHSDLCCEICAIAHHRKCDHVHEIAKVAKNVKNNERENIRASIIIAAEVIMKCKKDQLNNVSRVEEIVKEIDIYKEDLLIKIEEAKARIVSEMTNHNTQEDERLNTRRDAAENLKKELHTHLAMSDSVRENGTEKEVFILNHILKRTQAKASQTLNTLLKNDYTVKVGLKINENILKIKTTDAAVFSLNKTQLKTQEPKTQPVFRLDLMKIIDIMKTGDDKEEPFVTGLDFLSDGRIDAVDNNNWKCFILSDALKRFDTFYKFKTKSRDISAYSDKKIAVTVSYGDIRTICLLTVDSDNTISLVKTLKTSTYSFSICPLDDQTFVVSTYDDPRPARMIDVDGKESDFDNVKLPGKTYKRDESVCTYIPSRDSLVLTDRYANTVYMYNTVTGKSSELKDGRIYENREAPVLASMDPCLSAV